MNSLSAEIAITAARLIVEDGMEYGPAKRRAAKLLGCSRGIELPDNEQLEDEVRAHLALFCADSQPRELAALRELALHWMARVAAFRPHLAGAVWRGTATRHNDIRIELYCDDSKAAELALIDRGIDYETSTGSSPRGDAVDVLTVSSPSAALGLRVSLHFLILDYDDLRGALKLDSRGRPPRGDLEAVRQVVHAAS